jgi:hypothetical protein
MDTDAIQAKIEAVLLKWLAKSAEIVSLIRTRKYLWRRYHLECNKKTGRKWTSIWVRRLDENEGRQNVARGEMLKAEAEYETLTDELNLEQAKDDVKCE